MTVADAILRSSPVNIILRRRRRQLAVLGYHGVDDAERFSAHLDHLVRHATPVSLDDVVTAVDTGATLPDRAVLVTFDDGHRNIRTVAADQMAERGIPGVVFVVSELIGTSQPFWWTEVEELVGTGGRDEVRRLKDLPDDQRLAAIEELREHAPGAATPMPQLSEDDLHDLVARGIAIGNHSASHPRLTHCDREVVAAEVQRSTADLTRVLGTPPLAFAYPYGDFDTTTKRVVADAGYRVAFAFDHRLSPMPPPDAYAVSRLRVNATASVDRLDIILSGLHPRLLRARGRL